MSQWPAGRESLGNYKLDPSLHKYTVVSKTLCTRSRRSTRRYGAVNSILKRQKERERGKKERTERERERIGKVRKRTKEKEIRKKN